MGGVLLAVGKSTKRGPDRSIRLRICVLLHVHIFSAPLLGFSLQVYLAVLVPSSGSHLSSVRER